MSKNSFSKQLYEKKAYNLVRNKFQPSFGNRSGVLIYTDETVQKHYNVIFETLILQVTLIIIG